MFCILCYVILCNVVLSCVVLCMYVCPSSIYKSDMPWNELETPRLMVLPHWDWGLKVRMTSWPHDPMTWDMMGIGRGWCSSWPSELFKFSMPSLGKRLNSPWNQGGWCGNPQSIGTMGHGGVFCMNRGWDSYGLMHPEHPKTTSSHREPKHGKVFPQGQEHNCEQIMNPHK